MSRDVALRDDFEAVGFIRSFTFGMSQEDFDGDLKTQHACIRNLEVVGEAVRAFRNA